MKVINRNNYEEFFLLYIDNELDADKKEEVEKFVQQNADLSVELNMLKQTKCLPHEIIFSNKENLIRTEGISINESNYEEYFLLYTDNELSTAKRQEVETFILQHPKLQREFTSLKQALFEPEIISYGDKEDLYRAEKKRIVYLRPWRLTIAAAFIGLCAIGWWWLQKPEGAKPIAVLNSAINQSKQHLKPVHQDTGLQQTSQHEIVAQTTNKVKIEHGIVHNKKTETERKLKDVAKNNSSYPPILPANNKAAENNIVKQNEQPDVDVTDVATNPDHSGKEITKSALNQVTNKTEQNSSYTASPVAYKEINTNDEDNSLHVVMLDLNKDKVKGLLKKAGRLLTGKPNISENEDGKLQIANFEIETNKQ